MNQPLKGDRIPLMVHLTQAHKDALDMFAGERNVSRASVMRDAIASYIGYDLSSEPQVNRQRKYKDADERKRAQADREKAKRRLVRQLQDAMEDEEREDEVQALLASLKAL